MQTKIPDLPTPKVPDAPLKPKKSQNEAPLELELPEIKDKEPELPVIRGTTGPDGGIY